VNPTLFRREFLRVNIQVDQDNGKGTSCSETEKTREKTEMILKKVILLVALLIICSSSFARAGSKLQVRPQGGIGFLDGKAYSHAGLRVLLPSGDYQKYGLEVSHLNILDGADEFTALGIVLEQRLWGWFNMSIGTIGYFGYDENARNPVGLVTNLGWEPRGPSNWEPFVTYRNDIIFSTKIVVGSAVSVGMSYKFN
jgi:hypothetical protein